MLRVKSLVFAALSVTVAAVFFPVWFAAPVAVVLGVWGLNLAVFGMAVVVDADAGVLAFRMGLLTRRIRLTDVTAVLVDESKVSIARTGGEISLYAWRKSRLDGWLRVPAIGGDIGHAIASAVALAQDKAGGAKQAVRTGAAAGTRSVLASTLLGCTGLLALISALLVRVEWHNPVMTALGVILAVALGVSGLFYVLFTLWLLTRRAPRPAGDRPSAV